LACSGIASNTGPHEHPPVHKILDSRTLPGKDPMVVFQYRYR